ncbi:MAG: Mu-like prophage major head subunit gpT family protein, partial [Arcobacteraceae bacterium]
DRQLKGDVVFGTDKESDSIFRKYAEGILTDVSIGYKVNTATIEERKNETDIVTVTDFDIRELSAVGIGFDKGATVGRNEENFAGEINMNEKLRKELENLRKSVDDLNDTQKVRLDELSNLEKQNDTQKVDTKRVAADAVNTERTRVSEIQDLVAGGQITAQRAATFIKEGDELDMVRKAILDERSNDSKSIVIGNSDDNTNMQRCIEDAILMRVGFTPTKVEEGTENFRGASLLDMARSLTGYQGYDRAELVQRAMSTSDFPLLLGNVANRVIAGAFDEEEGTFALWTESVELPDFKTRNETKLSNQNGRLEKLKEGSEKKKIEFTESGESWALVSYGAEFKLTREMIINDDLGVFTDIVAEFGRMAKRTSNGLVYDYLQNAGDYTNHKMNDGKKVFDNTHNNMTAPGTALSSETLSTARTVMRRQKDGKKALNISPKYLFVAPESERTALQILNSEADVGSTNSGVMNPHKNSLVPIVDSELVDGPWYLAAARNTVKVGYLQGTNKQPIVQQINNNIDGAEFKCVFDFGVVVTDYRGLYKNLGA